MSLCLSGNRLVLKELTRADLPRALDVFTSNTAYNTLRNGAAAYSLADLEREFDSTVSIPSGVWLQIIGENKVIGVMHLVLSTPTDPKSWISLLLLHSDYQRQGLGREAVSLVEAYSQEHGCTQIHHGAIAENEPALLFWGRLGYEQYRQVSGPVGLLVKPVILVAKWLQESIPGGE